MSISDAYVRGSERPLDDVPEDVRAFLADFGKWDRLVSPEDAAALERVQAAMPVADLEALERIVQVRIADAVATANAARLAAKGERDRAVAEEREACAQIAEDAMINLDCNETDEHNLACENIAETIRARTAAQEGLTPPNARPKS